MYSDVNRNAICCFSGHRSIPQEDAQRLRERLDHVISVLISKGVKTFRCGGAMGFDTLAALIILEKKRDGADVSLDLFLPCRDQSSGWNEFNKEVYDYVLSEANNVHYSEEFYQTGCMLKRNREMVNGSTYCVVYCKKNSGGTAYTLNYATQKGVRTLNLA